VEARLKCVDDLAMPPSGEAEVLSSTMERFARRDDLATPAVRQLQRRQLVETFRDGIEVEPDAWTGAVYRPVSKPPFFAA
jgi:hypothetical protein